MRMVVQVLIVLNCLGSGVGVMVILGDLIPDVITRTALLMHDTRALSDPLLLNRKVRAGDRQIAGSRRGSGGLAPAVDL